MNQMFLKRLCFTTNSNVSILRDFRQFCSYKKSLQQDIDCVASSPDGSIIAMWHPEKLILYEHTKSIPDEQVNIEKCVLKEAEFKNLQRPKPDELVREELMALTYTTKHRWFPRSRDKKYRKPPVDREQL